MSRGKVGGSFPHLWISSVGVNEKGKSQQKKKKKGDEKREKEKEV